jgi:hypothetical protein
LRRWQKYRGRSKVLRPKQNASHLLLSWAQRLDGTFVLFTQEQMDLLFNHPTKILFKHDRSPSVASHTCVVSSCGRRGAMCARVSAGKKEARRATISRMTHAGPDQTHSIEFEAWPNRTWGEDSWQKSCQAWRVMKCSLCEDCGWVCEDHPGCRSACVAQQIAAPSSPGVVAENPARTSGLRSLG